MTYISSNPLLSGISDPIFVYRWQKRTWIIVDCNTSAAQLENVQLADICGKPAKTIFPGMAAFGILNIMDTARKERKSQHLATRFYDDGRISGWRENDIIPLEDEYLVVIYKDRSRSMSLQEQVGHAGYTDTLTHLYNRTFFDIRKRNLDKDDHYPLSVLIADINGLKFINDSFGHSVGDKHLRVFANILKKVVPDKSVVARWGGDEFAVLFPRTDSSKVQKIAERLKEAAEETRVSPAPLSISIGTATKEQAGEDMDSILQIAEDTLCDNKLLNKYSYRSSVVTALSNALKELTHDTEKHSERMLSIASQIGSQLQLMPQEIEELRILAVLHDIGKLGITVEILNKPDRLTESEWKEVQRHSEIGYRIAESCPELQHISKYILSIHERWDGTGYPQKLKGNAIPKLARIICIVDAFDAMISDRPYREAIPEEEALEEILRCSGSQFDPIIAERFVALMRDPEAALDDFAYSPEPIDLSPVLQPGLT